MNEWKNIKDAPRDGRNLFLLEKWNDVPFVGYWSDRFNIWVSDKSNFNTNGNAIVIDDIISDDVLYFLDIPEQPKKEY